MLGQAQERDGLGGVAGLGHDQHVIAHLHRGVTAGDLGIPRSDEGRHDPIPTLDT